MNPVRAVDPPRWLRVAGMLALTLVSTSLGALGWGSWAGYLGHPARAGAVALSLVFTIVASLSDFNFSAGKREDVANRWIILPGILHAMVLAWLLAKLDRRDVWVIGADGTRYLGLALLAVGGVLRVWPMFVLGRRFSALVAIQEGHELVTNGLYRFIRHPSYLGALLGYTGWVLVFRSGLGLLLLVPMVWLIVVRMDAEERLLASEFGGNYADYRKRTWRLLPGVY
ncbi:MAG TPA: isoprenylcysteine carboxylmethyltransferase family protein [Candidatus Binatus sp.]|nr:isoprenylcysteine carboxylmethyltransferase family protein [Candidatus Binatus sp.]